MSQRKKRKQPKGDYALLIRFTNMSDSERPHCWYSYRFYDKRGISVERFKSMVTSGKYAGLVEWAAIATTANIEAKAGASKHLFTYKRWPNGSTAWLSKEEENYLRKHA